MTQRNTLFPPKRIFGLYRWQFFLGVLFTGLFAINLDAGHPEQIRGILIMMGLLWITTLICNRVNDLKDINKAWMEEQAITGIEHKMNELEILEDLLDIEAEAFMTEHPHAREIIQNQRQFMIDLLNNTEMGRIKINALPPQKTLLGKLLAEVLRIFRI